MVVKRQPHDIVELHVEVGKLQVGGQQLLLRLQRLRLALDQVGVQRAAVLDLLHSLRLQIRDASILACTALRRSSAIRML